MSSQDPETSFVTRTASGNIQTTEGTLHVSRPFRSRTSKKMRAMITFVPRKSHFDTTNETSGANEFRGFFTLFWISLFIFTVRTYLLSYESEGHALNLRFATMFSQDAVTLAISDAVLVASSVICVPFAKAVRNGWIRVRPAIIVQHTMQTAILSIVIHWTYYRRWPWVQSGFLTLHTLVMLMKMHSYLNINFHLKHAHNQLQTLLANLRTATAESGGWEKAVEEAIVYRDRTNTASDGEFSNTDTPSVGTPPMVSGARMAYVDADGVKDLRRRLTSLGDKRVVVDEARLGSTNGGDDTPVDTLTADTQDLSSHPSERISRLARECVELQGELTSAGPERVTWPDNITYRNFAVYLLIPSLVYELEYPRTDHIRPLYLMEKAIAFFGSFTLLYTFTETFILPVMPLTHHQSFARSLLDLSLPFMISYLLLFYIIFECICNFFAEISYFADRQFYEDWWNSTSQSEFSRKWNIPVYSFLLRHVYASSITNYRLSRSAAMFLTFLLSACAHELVMVVVTQKIRHVVFSSQCIYFHFNSSKFLSSPMLGNIVFWLGLYAGFPLLCVGYVAY
ncbi:hypothetical protein FISHEDRAFT_55208 [Fistulina hepatica ATCC 64428]|uniref:O-acyltransferase n=1 Tax=Fistulina hepatica ATCC 64428 TaxID=1128425 RepID=A0A0D7ANM0_9AGAR|nr:hypothetical protein FISHEDRAFT_55208 [Fistulina hepatica ATCC 64428]